MTLLININMTIVKTSGGKMEIKSVFQDYGSTTRISKSILRNENGWGGSTTLAIDFEDCKIEHIFLDFKGTQFSGIEVEELRRLKALLNEFPEL